MQPRSAAIGLAGAGMLWSWLRGVWAYALSLWERAGARGIRLAIRQALATVALQVFQQLLERQFGERPELKVGLLKHKLACQ